MTDEFEPRSTGAETWYYARGGQKFGPFATAQVRQMAESGLLTADDMLFDGESGRWLSAGAAGLLPGPAAAATTAPARVAPAPHHPAAPNAVPVSAHAGPDSGVAARSPLDALLSVLALASAWVWLFGVGGFWRVAAGLVFVGFGLRAAATGRMIDFSGRWRHSPWYRAGGAAIALFGMLLAAGGLMEQPRSTRPTHPAEPRKTVDNTRPPVDGDAPKPALGNGSAASGNATEYATSQYLRGVEHAKRRDFIQAEVCFTTAIGAEPSLSEAYLGRGGVRAEQGDWAGAAEDLTAVIRQSTLREDHASAATAYRERGRCRVHLRDLGRAIADFTEAVRLRPGDADAYYYRGLALREAGDPERAKADFWEADRLRRPRE